MVAYASTGPRNFDELVKPLPNHVRDITIRLREIIRKVLPEAKEAVSGGARMGMVLYSIDGPNDVVCGMQPTEEMCKLFFHGWQQLRDAGYRLEGSGKNARHIKVRSLEEVRPEEVVQMIRIAWEAR